MHFTTATNLFNFCGLVLFHPCLHW